MRENQAKTISLEEGLRYDPALLGPFKFIPNCYVGPSKYETKFTSKHFGMGYVKMNGFHANPLILFSRMGVGLQIQ